MGAGLGRRRGLGKEGWGSQEGKGQAAAGEVGPGQGSLGECGGGGRVRAPGGLREAGLGPGVCGKQPGVQNRFPGFTTSPSGFSTWAAAGDWKTSLTVTGTISLQW